MRKEIETDQKRTTEEKVAEKEVEMQEKMDQLQSRWNQERKVSRTKFGK